MRWYWISLPYATFGIAGTERVQVAPPIARWAVGKGMDYVLGYYRRKGATIKKLEEAQNGD